MVTATSLPFVMFGLGTLFGVTLAVAIGMFTWRRRLGMYRDETRAVVRAELDRHLRQTDAILRTVEAERSTLALKVPLEERPTIVSSGRAD